MQNTNNLLWKYLGKTVGTKLLELPSNWNELILYVNEISFYFPFVYVANADNDNVFVTSVSGYGVYDYGYYMREVKIRVSRKYVGLLSFKSSTNTTTDYGTDRMTSNIWYR